MSQLLETPYALLAVLLPDGATVEITDDWARGHAQRAFHDGTAWDFWVCMSMHGRDKVGHDIIINPKTISRVYFDWGFRNQ